MKTQRMALPRAIAGFGVRADASDPKVLIGQLQAAFEDFKRTNDEKLKAKADVVTDEKVTRIDASVSELQAAIDAVNAKLSAQALGAGQRELRDAEYSNAFLAHMRKGDVQAALSKGSNPDGGYTTPVEWDRTIIDALKVVSPMRRLAQVQTISTGGFTRLYNDRAIGSGWVGETAARPQTTTPQLTPLGFTLGEIYANPAATQQLLDDSEINIEQWLANEVETEFARQEGIAYMNGDGVNKPFGLLSYTTGGTAAGRHPAGVIPDVTAAGATAVTGDDILNLIYAVPSELLGNSRFLMNRLAQAGLRKLKDGQGNYIWQPSVQAGEPATLFGYPVEEEANMQNVATGTRPIAFGDFRRGYLILDRIGVRVMRDPYTNKPYVHFYTTKRVGGGVQDPTVLRFLKMA